MIVMNNKARLPYKEILEETKRHDYQKNSFGSIYRNHIKRKFKISLAAYIKFLRKQGIKSNFHIKKANYKILVKEIKDNYDKNYPYSHFYKTYIYPKYKISIYSFYLAKRKSENEEDFHLTKEYLDNELVKEVKKHDLTKQYCSHFYTEHDIKARFKVSYSKFLSLLKKENIPTYPFEEKPKDKKKKASKKDNVIGLTEKQRARIFSEEYLSTLKTQK